jgi:hypothetical protein
VIVGHVAVETCNIGDEFLIIVWRDTRFKSSCLKYEKIFFLEISLEDQEKSW